MTKPIEVKRPNISTIKLHDTTNGIVESLNKRNDSALSTSTSSDESKSLAGFKSGSETLQDRNAGSRRVMESDIFKADLTMKAVGVETFLVSGIDGGYTVDSSEKLGSSASRFGDSSQLGSKHGHGEGTNKDGHENIDDDTGVGVAITDENTTVVEGEGVRGVDGEDCIIIISEKNRDVIMANDAYT